jgi:hypothetical protein
MRVAPERTRDRKLVRFIVGPLTADGGEVVPGRCDNSGRGRARRVSSNNVYALSRTSQQGRTFNHRSMNRLCLARDIGVVLADAVRRFPSAPSRGGQTMDRKKKAAQLLDDTFTKIHKRAPRNHEEFDLWLKGYSETEAGKQMLRQMGEILGETVEQAAHQHRLDQAQKNLDAFREAHKRPAKTIEELEAWVGSREGKRVAVLNLTRLRSRAGAAGGKIPGAFGALASFSRSRAPRDLEAPGRTSGLPRGSMLATAVRDTDRTRSQGELIISTR